MYVFQTSRQLIIAWRGTEVNMEDVWKKVGDAWDWISSSFGYKQARTKKTKHSDIDVDLDSELECVCEEPEKV